MAGTSLDKPGHDEQLLLPRAIPGAGAERRGRVIEERPAERDRGAPPPPARHGEAPGTLRACDRLRGVQAPFDRRQSLQLEQVAGFEIDEQQRAARLAEEVA